MADSHFPRLKWVRRKLAVCVRARCVSSVAVVDRTGAEQSTVSLYSGVYLVKSACGVWARINKSKLIELIKSLPGQQARD